MMNITKELGLRIRYYRKEKHLTQEQLSEICNLHPTYIGQIERGEKNATVESIYKIATGLEIPVSKLLENIEGLENDHTSVPLSAYRLVLSLPYSKQKQVEKIIQEIVDLLNG